MLHLAGNPQGPSLSFSSFPTTAPFDGLFPSSILIVDFGAAAAAAAAGSAFGEASHAKLTLAKVSKKALP